MIQLRVSASPRLGTTGRPSGELGHAGGVAVFRGGLKKGVGTTVARAHLRAPSIVTSIRTSVPAATCGASIVARAISFFIVGDQAVVVARPICSPFRMTGTGCREAAAGATGASP